MSESNEIWQVWAETGGTFTDCIAVNPTGEVHRAKVLSSSALRGSLLERIGPKTWRIRERWNAPKDFVSGHRLALMGDTEAAATILAYDPDAQTLELEDEIAVAPGDNTAFEVRFPCEAPILAARLVTCTLPDQPLPPMALRVATTRGTNALLTRRGTPPAFFVTKGFRDLLEIGTQQRPDLFALDIVKPQPLTGSIVEVDERLNADGTLLRPLDEAAIVEAAEKLVAAGVRTAAVALMHSYLNPVHELRVADLLFAAGFAHVSVSSRLAPFIKHLPRAQTAVVNAYLSPILDAYLNGIKAELPSILDTNLHGMKTELPSILDTNLDGTKIELPSILDTKLDDTKADLPQADSKTTTLHVMTSAGGLVQSGDFHPKDSLLSGPAGGVVGALHAGRAAGFDRIIAFDMGGTSTDVARCDGGFDYTWEHQIGNAHLVAPALAIESVAAGGGSICYVDHHGQLQVGPQSAGASPGPACYGAGGPLTLTDVNLLLGRLNPENFEIPIDLPAAQRALEALLADLAKHAAAHPENTTIGNDAQPQNHRTIPSPLQRTQNQNETSSYDNDLNQTPDPSNPDTPSSDSPTPTTRTPDTLPNNTATPGTRTSSTPTPDTLTPNSLSNETPTPNTLLNGTSTPDTLTTNPLLNGILTPNTLLNGLLDIANERMADAIRKISLRRGYDPAEYALVAFGGAGDQHACAVAQKLGIKTVIVPADASLLSAYGLGQAAIERFAERQILRPLTQEWETQTLPTLVTRLEAEAIEKITAENIPSHQIAIHRRIITLRLIGQESALEIELSSQTNLTNEFSTRYQSVYGYHPAPTRLIEIEALRITAQANPSQIKTTPPASKAPEIHPDAGWQSQSHPSGATILTAIEKTTTTAQTTTPESVQETLFAGRFTALAEEMGEALRRTALSTNVKERLDFSCALLDPSGNLVANAAHIPVHLGALGECVRRVSKALPLGPGDVAITNHPGFGGSHLPDITVITPVYDENGIVCLGWVASRAHHVEMGGTRPGSMPPDARTLAEEGVVLSPTYLVRDGHPQLDEICRLLSVAPYPTRALDDNRADLEAALAANRRGSDLLERLAAEHGTARVWHYMERLQARAEAALRNCLHAFDDGDFSATEYLDDGTPITVRMSVNGDSAVIDFAGTGTTSEGNLNATPAIATSAVLYVLRLLVREELPLNEGLMRPITLRLPAGTIVNPRFDLADPGKCPAVVGGNTETSQRIVDTLLKALGLAAGSQGTMNNTLWGNSHFGYYETVCGGAGATAKAPGASAVHTHMTNTRITDAEIMEMRYPVRIERFERRRGSGGKGMHAGGDGVIRETVFLEPVALSMLTQHRSHGPSGLAGGSAGSAGRQQIVRASGGDVLELAAISACEIEAGDRLILETPGGGGHGQMRQ